MAEEVYFAKAVKSLKGNYAIAAYYKKNELDYIHHLLTRFYDDPGAAISEYRNMESHKWSDIPDFPDVINPY